VLTFSEPARIEASGQMLEMPQGQAPRLLLDQAATVIVSGSYQTQEKRLHVTEFDVTAGKREPVAKVSLPQGTSVDLTMSGKRGVTGAAKLAVRADLAALQGLAQRYSGAAAATQPSAEGLKSGIFMGDIGFEITPMGDLRLALTDSSLDFDYVVGATAYRDRVGINAAADVSGDNATIGTTLDAKGKTLALATKAQLAMAVAPDKTQGLKTIRVEQLDGKTDFAEVALTQPLVISDVPALQEAFKGRDVPAGTQIGGALRVRADLGRLMALAGKQGAYAINGTLTATPKISLVQSAVVADFDSQIESLKVTQGNRTVVQEPKLTAGGRVSVDPKAQLLDVSNLAVTSSTGLMDLKGNLKVSQYGTANKIENGTMDLTPDLGMLWPIVYAMMPPEQQTKIGEMTLAGKKTSHITLSGSFPTDRPYAEAIELLVAGGDFAIESLDWKKYGVTLSGVIPFNLKDGIVHFAYADNRTAQPLACNQGTVDLSKASIDMTGTDPRLSIEPKTAVARGLQLNSVMLASLGSYVAPVFDPALNLATGAVQGSIDLTCDRCDRLPLGQLMFSTAPINDGVAQFSISINGLGVGGNGLNSLLGAVGAISGEQSFQLAGDLKNATVTIEKGRGLQNVVLPINKKLQLPLQGDLRLADNYYNSLKLALPRDVAAPLLSKSAGLKLSPDDLPQTIGVGFSGPVGKLKLNTDIASIVAPIAQQQLQKRVLGGLLGGQGTQSQQKPAPSVPGQVLGQGGQQQTATQPAGQQKQPDAVNAVEGLIDLFGKKKK
jgi:hypothetical protein